MWHDCEDERSGADFKVEASDPSEAYFKAIKIIKEYSQYLAEHFCSIDLEGLVDESGEFLHPDFFLKEDSARDSPKQETDSVSIWEKLFNRYKEVKYFPLPAYKLIRHKPVGSTTNVYEKLDGQDKMFEDLQNKTSFYNFSQENLRKLLAQTESNQESLLFIRESFIGDEDKSIELREGILIYKHDSDKTTIGEKLEQLIKRGKKVTHIVRAEEVYGGGTHSSVWRNYERAEIYEVG